MKIRKEQKTDKQEYLRDLLVIKGNRDVLFIKSYQGQLNKVLIKDIIMFIETGQKVKVVTVSENFKTSRTLNGIIKDMPLNINFRKVNDNTIVNINQIDYIKGKSIGLGSWEVTLKSEEALNDFIEHLEVNDCLFQKSSTQLI